MNDTWYDAGSGRCCSAGASAAQAARAQELLRMELLFRLATLRTRYPDQITADMERRWREDVRAGRQLGGEPLRQLELHDASIREAARASGARGASGSFGGGHSGGGGGRGGSW